MTLPEKFCIAPFKNAVVDTTGNLIPCCEYMQNGSEPVKHIVQWWGTGLALLRDKMLTGTEDAGCNHCLSKEQNDPSYMSHRKNLNKLYSKDIVQAAEDYSNGLVGPIRSIELRVSNYCSLKCFMCGDYASSAIRDEYRQHSEKYNKLNVYMSDVKTVKWWDDADTMDQLIPILENVNSVHLAGGEPLLVPRLFELLEQVRQKNHFRITFNTSLFTKNKKLLDKIAVFKNTRVMVSLDGVEQHNDYVRYGSDWQTIVSNLELLEQNRMMLSITHVLQHTSIFALPALIKFVEQKRIELHLHEVYAGSYPAEGVLTINSAHPADVESFKQWLKTYTGAYKNQISNWIENYSYDSTLNNKFHQYVDMLDSIRGTNFKEVFKPTL